MLDAHVIGNRIRLRREEIEKTKEVLCEEVGISLSALTMYETGQRIARDEIKPKLARALGMTIESLFFAL